MTSYSAISDVYNNDYNEESNNLDAMAREINDNKRKHKLIKNTYQNLYNESIQNKKKLRELKDPDNPVGRFMPEQINDSEVSLNSQDRFNKGFTLINDLKQDIIDEDSFMLSLKNNNFSSNSSIINDISIKSPVSSESEQQKKVLKKRKNKKDKYLDLIKNIHPEYSEDSSFSHEISHDPNFSYNHIKHCKKCKRKMKEILRDDSEEVVYNKVSIPRINEAPPDFIFKNQQEEELILGYNKKQLRDIFIIVFFVLIIILMIFLIIRLMR